MLVSPHPKHLHLHMYLNGDVFSKCKYHAEAKAAGYTVKNEVLH